MERPGRVHLEDREAYEGWFPCSSVPSLSLPFLLSLSRSALVVHRPSLYQPFRRSFYASFSYCCPLPPLSFVCTIHRHIPPGSSSNPRQTYSRVFQSQLATGQGHPDMEITQTTNLPRSLSLPGPFPGMPGPYRSMIGVLQQVMQSLLDRMGNLRHKQQRPHSMKTKTHQKMTTMFSSLPAHRPPPTPSHARIASTHFPGDAISSLSPF